MREMIQWLVKNASESKLNVEEFYKHTYRFEHHDNGTELD